MPHRHGMEPIAAITSIDAAQPIPSPVALDPMHSEAAVPPSSAPHARACTGFDRYPCILDPAAASIAAAAAAQDLRAFQLSQLRLRVPRETR